MKFCILGYGLISAFLNVSHIDTQHRLHADTQHHAHWGYDNQKMWGDLEPSYIECKVENLQSPINILDSRTTQVDESSLVSSFASNVAYNPNMSVDVVNNGHTIQVGFNKSGFIVYRGIRYNLVQLHFHTPSENQVNSKAFPAEVHLVHKDEHDNILVIGVFIQAQDEENAALAHILEAVPKEVDKKVALRNLEIFELLPSSAARYEYDGSLTTPPCSGHVRWVVMKDSIKASQNQIDALHNIMEDNARELQPINGREILSVQ